jgi:hypothetical protein
MIAIDLQPLVVLLPASEGGAGKYVDWWVVHVSVANLVVIVLMVLTFVAALLVPFPGGGEWVPRSAGSPDTSGPDEAEGDR